MNEGRTPPQDLGAERAALGSVLVDPRRLDDLADLTDNDFWLPSHRVVFRAMRRAAKAGAPLDVVSLADEIKRDGANIEGGAEAFVLDLARETPIAQNAAYYGRIVANKAALRRLIMACGEIAAAASGEARPALELLAEARTLITEIATNAAGANEPRRLGDILDGLMLKLQAWSDNRTAIGIPTGLTELDNHYRGLLSPERLIVVAGRPGTGKSSLAAGWARSAARAGHPTLHIALEMSEDEEGIRALASASGLSGTLMSTGKLKDAQQWALLNGQLGRLSDLPLWIVSANMTLGQIESVARRWVARNAPPDGKVPMIVLDMLQLARVPDADSREQAVATVATACKRLARDLRLPLVAVSSMNRESAKVDEEPQLHHLRESGQIESDADAVLFVVRRQGEATARILIRKNRGAPTGEITVRWDGPTTTFADRDDLSPQQEEFAETWPERRFSDP